jgi:hypothetical protein
MRRNEREREMEMDRERGISYLTMAIVDIS